jgi:hypothetical protein
VVLLILVVAEAELLVEQYLQQEHLVQAAQALSLFGTRYKGEI